jgi:hypothetical protein
MFSSAVYLCFAVDATGPMFITDIFLKIIPLFFLFNFSPYNIFSTAIFELFCGIFRYLATVTSTSEKVIRTDQFTGIVDQ